MSEREQQGPVDDEQTADQSPEEFAEEIENDPSHNPDDEGLEQVRGG